MSFWIPDYELGDKRWWMKFAAYVMMYVRIAWYHGAKEKCNCPGCYEMIPRAEASGFCRECFPEDCLHDYDEGGVLR